MKIEIPNIVIQELVDANIIQTHWNIHSTEVRSQQATRLQWHFAEYVSALIGKELRNRNILPYETPPARIPWSWDERGNTKE